MSLPKLSDFAINFEGEEEFDGVRRSSITGEVSQSSNQSARGVMDFRLLVSNSDFMDLEPNLNDFSICGSDVDVELRLGIGSESGSVLGQLRSVSDGHDLILEEAMVADQDNILIQESAQVSHFRLEQEQQIEEAARDNDQYHHWQDFPDDDYIWINELSNVHVEEAEHVEELSNDHDTHWQVLYSDDDVGFLEDSEDVISLYDDIYGLESAIIGSPPASAEDLVEITSEELQNGNIVCAICINEIVIEEKVRKLPCKHYYHGECLIPWLRISNTCPVCRFQLPTYDLHNESNQRTIWHDLDSLLWMSE